MLHPALRVLLLGLLAASGGCGGDSATGERETPVKIPDRTGPPDDGDGGVLVPTDAGVGVGVDVRSCDPAKPFGMPLPLFDPKTFGATPRLSRDERNVYFTALGAGYDLYRAERSDRSAAFERPILLAAQSGPSDDNDPTVAPDGLRLFFHSARSGNMEIYASTRSSLASDFGAASPVAQVNDPLAADAHPFFRPGELWLTSQRGSTTFRMFRAKQLGDGFEVPQLVENLSGAWDDWQPMITDDGLTLLFASNRPEGKGGFDLWMASRAHDGDPWPSPVAATELNSAGHDFAGWISADRCRLYFSSDRETGDPSLHRLYVAERPL